MNPVADVVVVPLPNITDNVYVWYGNRLCLEGTEDEIGDYILSDDSSKISFGFELEVGDIVRIITVDPLDGRPLEWRQLEIIKKIPINSFIDTETGDLC
jgi:hypothetical protein